VRICLQAVAKAFALQEPLAAAFFVILFPFKTA
jgi:hypothetical protein